MSTYAIVIGVNHYLPPAESGLRALAGAIPDAMAVADWLRGPGAVPEENLYLLTSVVGREKVLRHNVEETVAEITRKVVQQGADADRLYFYFAGHGMGIESDIENNALIMSNWDHYIFDAGTLSSSDYKTKFATEGFFKEVVLWLDCCRNKKLRLSPAPSAGVNFRGRHRNPKVFLGFGTTYDNAAYEAAVPDDPEREPRGIFTQVLLEGLSGAAVNAEGIVDSESLTGYLYDRVPVAARQAGFSQEPEIIKNTGGARRIIFS